VDGGSSLYRPAWEMPEHTALPPYGGRGGAEEPE
jgi:hypothetical protein